MEDHIKELNDRIKNPIENLSSEKGFEVLTESLVYKVYDIFGRNVLLSILYQTGTFPGEVIADRIKQEYGKEEFEVIEAVVILMDELKDFYSIQIREIQQLEDRYRIIIENHCFLREPIKHREKLKFGKALCRINKAYFETAFQKLLGNKVKKIEINYLENDENKDACVEELNFYLK
ncbi:MAG: hypothetical protein ACW986_13010 [Promethearchaeota archaeon]